MQEEELKAYWKTVVDTIQEGVMIVDLNGSIVAVNQALTELTGFQASELIGQSCATLNCATCRAKRDLEGHHWCSLFDQGRMNKQRCAVLRKNGRYVQVLKNASVLRNQAGEVIGGVETLTDISGLLERDTAIEAFRRELSGRDTFNGMVGRSAAMQRVYDLLDNAADSDAPLAIYGESGTGKELAARAVHERGKRRDQPYIKVNCAALNEALLESELFGHVRGAFTGAHQGRTGRFEAANGGSLFLDEIGDLPMVTQVKLLRVLEEKVIERVGDNQPVNVDVRIITATNRNLEAMVAEGTFRQDLFYRINVIPVTIPPLRERIEDVPLLAESFFRTLQLKSGKNIGSISRKAMDVLMAYSWPGNVRELRSTFEYAFVTCQKDSIGPEDLPSSLSLTTRPLSRRQSPQLTSRTPKNKDQRKKEALIMALHEADGNQSRAAEILGVSRVTVWNQMKRYGLKTVREVKE
ncbi:sigma 54-interacting transcriptional regulator [Desulfobulbus rhabdoformis]|uniref:sigma-54 interaction domain-containing protein n=1 Tax=Desulfobulbus rhabdoformis TaxID=34032 RepID=UPI00196669CF|nr:sigma 54-interacting transcriptional regulator [Desulfobulbus rhabdoformis]MBM9614263.1 sigma 54-interacting transcriptional regulator [Desulfobulbus rhabdoformis]